MVRRSYGPTWIPTVTFTFDVFCLEAARKPRGKSAQQQRDRNGYDLADHFPLVTEAVEELPVRSCVIDGETKNF